MKRQEILRELVEPKSIWELLDNWHYTLAEFIPIMNELYKEGLIRTDGKRIYLTEKGKKKMGKYKVSSLCKKCKGRRIEFTREFEKLLKSYREIVKKRPEPDLKYFQGYMRDYDVISRVILMNYYHDIADKKILLIGDDDLLSVALSLTNLPSKIVVLDIDRRLGKFINKVSKKYSFNISFLNYNVSDPLPDRFLKRFDVFSSEPLETYSGLRTFVLRGILSLKVGGIGYFGLTNLESSFEKWKKLQRFLLRNNCVITDVIRDFSVYPTVYETANYELFTRKFNFPTKSNPGIDWYKSSLFRIMLMKDVDAGALNRKMRVTIFDPKEDLTHPILYE
jgi:hypothetical protein